MAQTKANGVIVTGATSGIGREITKALNEDGVSVVVADLNEDMGQQAAAEISGRGPEEATFKRVDLTDQKSVHAAAEDCQKRFGGL
jgi:NAD(P)-dependent dehydrogenase (short-subunit alcohol dehydrogenase family)